MGQTIALVFPARPGSSFAGLLLCLPLHGQSFLPFPSSLYIPTLMGLLCDLGNARFFEKIYGVVFFVYVFNLYKWYFALEHLLFLIFFHLTRF